MGVIFFGKKSISFYGKKEFLKDFIWYEAALFSKTKIENR